MTAREMPPLARVVRKLWRVAGLLLPGDTWAGALARRLLARFVPVPKAEPPKKDDGESADLLTVPDTQRVRVIVEHLLDDDRSELVFPDQPSPSVSIVLVASDAVHKAYRCLESILAHAGAGYELVVVDDDSGDRTRDLLSRLRNATRIRHEAQLGSIKARNRAAKDARGRYLLLLDEDLALAPGSVTALLETIEADGTCGAASGKLVRPDGRLQEAGGVIWCDGTVQPYGAGAPALAPETSYAREVDACSGAFLLVRKEVFEQAGGFDEGFAPGGPYDAADLCMAFRREGHRVLFAPNAIAFRCVEADRPDEGTEAANHSRFAGKWKAELERQPDRSAVSLLAARNRATGPRVLVVEDRIPAPSRGAGYPRSHAMLEMLRSLGYTVTVFPYHDRTADQPWVHDLQRAGIEAMACKVPFAEFAAERSVYYDAIVVSRPPNLREVAPFLSLFRGAGVVYDAEALWFMREKRKAEVEGVPWTGHASEREELALLKAADLVVTVSDHEKRVAIAAVPELEGRVHVWGHPVRSRPTSKAFGERQHLLFVGGFQLSPSPNEDAVRHFVRAVLPALRSRLDCALQVVGYGAPEALAGCASEDVRLTGCVDDLTEWYENCRVFVVPHLYAAGIPLKLCEAMGRGIPAVVSELIATQLGVEDGREVLVGRTPEEFADKVVELYANELLWTRLRENGLAFVGRRHDPDALKAELDTIVRMSMSAARRRTATNSSRTG